MDNDLLKKVAAELDSSLRGRKFGRIFPLSRTDVAVDFRLPDSRYLFISVDTRNPRIYLIRRKLRELEKGAIAPFPFHLLLRKNLAGAAVEKVYKLAGDRIIQFDFALGNEKSSLVVQLTGRSANVFILDDAKMILAKLRQTSGTGQEIGEAYSPPHRSDKIQTSNLAASLPTGFGDLSETLDHFYLSRKEADRFQELAKKACGLVNKKLSGRKKLIAKLKDDLKGHGCADHWKRLGDLLLANAATNRRERDTIFVIDYFDETAPEIAIEIESGDTITEAAEKFFKRYSKARNATREISKRIGILESGIKKFEAEMAQVEKAIAEKDETALADFAGIKADRDGKPKKKSQPQFTGARVFQSTDGLEILVGKKAKDNDYLTFRIAKSLDLWLHAADYPGSHVIVRNPNRKEIPQRTLLEAAQLAAFYSDARKQAKAAVHYTRKKFVNKPRVGAPGLVSLASFKTVLVEPKVSIGRE